MTCAGQAARLQSSADGRNVSLPGLYEVFLNPGRLFEKMRETPRVLIPYVVVIVIVLVYAMSVSGVMLRMQLEAMQERGAQLPPGFDAHALRMSGIGVMLLVSVVTPLAAAGLAMFFGGLVMAGHASFRQLLSVMVYGEIVYMFGQLVHLPMILLKKTMMVSLSPAALVPHAEPSSLLWAGLSKLGLFNIWELIVIGIGLSVVFGFSRNKGYILAVLSMGLLSILQVITTLIGSTFG